MKREDFEELVRLLQDWLEAVGTPGEMGQAEHAKLKAWTCNHDAKAVRAISNRVAMHVGWLGNDDRLPIRSLIPNYDSERFPTLIASFDSLVRSIAAHEPDSLVSAIPAFDNQNREIGEEVILTAWGQFVTPSEVQYQIDMFLPGLGDELKHIEGGDIDVSDLETMSANVCNATRGKEARKRQKAAFDALEKGNKIHPGMDFRTVAEKSEELAGKDPDKYQSFGKDKARDLMKLRWPKYYRDDET